MGEVNFVDTTMRDGNASLWAEGMTTGMMLAVADDINKAGFRAVELTGISHFKKCVRELREDPWERLRLISKKITECPLAIMTFYSISPFARSPLCMVKLFSERLAANGIRRAQMLDPANDMNFMLPHAVKFSKDAGMEVVMALVYSLSPVHTDEYYAQKARDAAKLNVDAIYLKDPGGLLTPERIKTLMPVVLKNAGNKPVEFHSHCTTGLAPQVYLEAIKLGAKTVHTAIPPLANGSSQPSVLNIASNARFLGYTPDINEGLVKSVADQLTYFAKRARMPIGTPLEYDVYQYVHQVPGGVISNLRHQLSLLRMLPRLPQVLEEAVRVRKELGYPIMVTPFSQFVVSQAAINIISGERYKDITDELIYYATGYWGKEACASIEPNVLDKILSRPRAKELSAQERPEPTIEEMRAKLGGAGVSDDELVLRYMVGSEEEIKAMRAAGPMKVYRKARTPLITLVEELTKRKDANYISIQKDGFSLTLSRNRNTEQREIGAGSTSPDKG